MVCLCSVLFRIEWKAKKTKSTIFKNFTWNTQFCTIRQTHWVMQFNWERDYCKRTEMKWNGMTQKHTRSYTHSHNHKHKRIFFLRNQTKCVWCTLRFKSPNLSRTPIENIVHEIWFCHSFVDFKLIGVHCSFICTKIFSHWYDRITAIYDHFHWFHSVVSSFLVIKFYWF